MLLPLAGVREDRVLGSAAFDYRLAMQAVREFLTPEQLEDSLRAFATTAYNSVLRSTTKQS